MAGTVTCIVNSAELEKQIARTFAKGKKTLPDIVNQRSLNVTGRAFNETPIADKVKMVSEIGVTAYKLVRRESGPRKGMLRRDHSVKIFAQGETIAAPLLALIINARRGRAGKKGLHGTAMRHELTKVLASRKRSVGFEKSAYFPALKGFAAALPKPFKIARTKGISTYGRPKGFFKVAKPGWTPNSLIVNNAKEIVKVDRGVLQRAVDTEAREMQRHLDKDIKPIIDVFNAPTR